MEHSLLLIGLAFVFGIGSSVSKEDGFLGSIGAGLMWAAIFTLVKVS